MPIRLRLALHGTRHNRIFHLVAIDRGHRRDGKPTETLGIYNPHITKGHEQKTIEWSVDRIRYWLHVGALPSKSVVKLLEMVSLLYSSFPAPVLNVVYCLQGKILEPNSQYHPKATGPKSAKAWSPFTDIFHYWTDYRWHIGARRRSWRSSGEESLSWGLVNLRTCQTGTCNPAHYSELLSTSRPIHPYFVPILNTDICIISWKSPTKIHKILPFVREIIATTVLESHGGPRLRPTQMR